MQIHSTVAPTLTDAMLSDCQRSLGFSLPDCYAVFLRTNNGGVPTPNTVDTPSFPPSSCTDVRCFFGVHAYLNAADLVWNYGVWKRDSPAKLLPIADDSGGSTFCMSLSDDDAGRIYYWDWYRTVCPTRTRYPFIYPIANSLEEFLGMLREWTD